MRKKLNYVFKVKKPNPVRGSCNLSLNKYIATFSPCLRHVFYI